MTFSIFICGSILFVALFFQYRLLNGLYLEDVKSQRTAFYVPCAIAAIILLGTTFFVVADYFNETSSFRRADIMSDGFVQIMKAALFGFIVVFKSIFGPLFGGLIVSYSVWFFAKGGELVLFPAMEWAISLLIANASTNAATSYTAVFLIVTLAMGLYRGGGTISTSDLGPTA